MNFLEVGECDKLLRCDKPARVSIDEEKDMIYIVEVIQKVVINPLNGINAKRIAVVCLIRRNRIIMKKITSKLLI
jgi:hypothetical protein